MNAEFGLSLDLLAVFVEVDAAGDFEGTSARNNSLIVIDVLDSSESVSCGFLDLRNGVLVGAFDQNSARLGILDSGDESVLLLSKDVFLNKISVSQMFWLEFLNRVDCLSSAGKHNPFHVSSLGSSQGDDTGIGEHLKANGVDSLLVDDHKASVVALCYFFLEFDDLPASLICELPLTLGHFVPVSSIREEELRIDLSLFVLKRHVAGQDMAIPQLLRHIRMSSTVIQHQSLHELRITRQPMNHMHDFNHMEVDRFISDFDNIDSLNDDIDQLIGKVRVKFGTECGSGNTDEDRFFYGFFADLEGLQKFERFLPGEFVSLGDDTRMHLFLHESLGLFHHLSDEEHV